MDQGPRGPTREPGDRPARREPSGSHIRHCGGRCARVAPSLPSPLSPTVPAIRSVIAQRACCVGRNEMKISPYPGSAAALLLILSTTAFADGSPDTVSPDTVQLGTVTTTATRTPLIADEQVAPVIVIGPQQIQLAQGQDVGAVLKQYAGLDVAQN